MGKEFCYQEKIGFTIGDDCSITHGYNALGRFTSASSSVASVLSVATYSYLPNSDLISTVATALSAVSGSNYLIAYTYGVCFAEKRSGIFL